MFDILNLIPGKKRPTASGWHSFNAVCCHHRGHRPDSRHRGGIRFDGNNWVMHCFNCGFKCSFTLGQSIGQKTRTFLGWLGIDSDQIQRWNLESLQNKDLLQLTVRKKENIKFVEKKLPATNVLEVNNIKHKKFVDYLTSRKIDIDKYTFYVNPDSKDRIGNGIVVPYYYKQKIVGSTIRFLDNKKPKYLNDQQQGYVFNLDKQKQDWQVCIVTEGIFDAISIDGVAIMHDDISSDQAVLLSQLNRTIIVVPDFDITGLKITDRALELGFKVSLPNWEPGIKDVNDAVIKYGKLATILSIIENATSSKIKIELRKKQIVKGI
jgi:DNA primase